MSLEFFQPRLGFGAATRDGFFKWWGIGAEAGACGNFCTGFWGFGLNFIYLENISLH